MGIILSVIHSSGMINARVILERNQLVYKATAVMIRVLASARDLPRQQ
jgi:hypothetical protein